MSNGLDLLYIQSVDARVTWKDYWLGTSIWMKPELQQYKESLKKNLSSLSRDFLILDWDSVRMLDMIKFDFTDRVLVILDHGGACAFDVLQKLNNSAKEVTIITRDVAPIFEASRIIRGGLSQTVELVQDINSDETPMVICQPRTTHFLVINRLVSNYYCLTVPIFAGNREFSFEQDILAHRFLNVTNTGLPDGYNLTVYSIPN